MIIGNVTFPFLVIPFWDDAKNVWEEISKGEKNVQIVIAFFVT